MLHVQTVMKKDVITVKPYDFIDKVLRILILHNVTGLPVVDDDMTVVGVITEKDILAYLLERGKLHLSTDDEFRETKVERVMTSDPVTFDADADISDVCGCLVNRNFRRVPITDKNGKLVGIISRKDIISVIS